MNTAFTSGVELTSDNWRIPGFLIFYFRLFLKVGKKCRGGIKDSSYDQYDQTSQFIALQTHVYIVPCHAIALT